MNLNNDEYFTSLPNSEESISDNTLVDDSIDETSSNLSSGNQQHDPGFEGLVIGHGTDQLTGQNNDSNIALGLQENIQQNDEL